MSLKISCALAPSLNTPEHVGVAEALGYHRAWIYDSPSLYHEAFMALARAADATEVIGLGTGVMIPSLRHPMTAAASIAALVEVAPGRVSIGVGTGFTGRATLGQKALPWRVVEDWVGAVQALLRGEQVSWNGALIQMIHPRGFGPERPIVVPWIVAAEGPRGRDVAAKLGDGVFSLAPVDTAGERVALAYGTVMADDEDLTSTRVVSTAGPTAVVVLHGAYASGVRLVESWSEQIDHVPVDARHLSVHAGHLVELTELDRPYITPELITSFTFTGHPAQVREWMAARRDEGVTEVAFQPVGPDVVRELETFYAAVEGL